MHDIFSGDIDTSLYTVDTLKTIESSLSEDGVFVLVSSHLSYYLHLPSHTLTCFLLLTFFY
jgi:hypothetical protein